MTRLILVNPNTSATTTAVMVNVARAAAPGVSIEGMTASFGVPLITDEPALAQAAEAVAALAPALSAAAPDGVIVAAFGDPGLWSLRRTLPMPVTGIAEAGMAEASAGGRRFAVVTTTPALVAVIAHAADTYGCARSFAGTWTTPGDPAEIMANPDKLVEALAESCRQASCEGGADAVVIGGGPLALAARTLAPMLGIPLVEPVPAAARLAIRRAGETR